MCLFNVRWMCILFLLFILNNLRTFCWPTTPNNSFIPNITTNYNNTETAPTETNLLSVLKDQPLAEINVTFPLLEKFRNLSPQHQQMIAPKTITEPLLGLELFPKEAGNSKTNTVATKSYNSNQTTGRPSTNSTKILPIYEPKMDLLSSSNRTTALPSTNVSRISSVFQPKPDAFSSTNSSSVSSIAQPKTNASAGTKMGGNIQNILGGFPKQPTVYTPTNLSRIHTGSDTPTAQSNLYKPTSPVNNNPSNQTILNSKNYQGASKTNSTSTHSNDTFSHRVSNDSRFTKEYVAETSEDREWCNKTSLDTISCRQRISGNIKTPHISSSDFTGNIGIKSTGGNGTQVLGGETNNKYNETMKFKMGKGNYEFQNLTNFHNCSGCLKNKNLIKNNKTADTSQKGEKNKEDELSEISKLRTKLLDSEDRNNFLARNLSKVSSNSSDNFENVNFNLSKILKNNKTSNVTPEVFNNDKQIAMGKNNKTKSNPSKILGKDDKTADNKTSHARNEILERRCEEVDSKRDRFGKEVANGFITNCVTKRKLVSTKHTKTKKNGKVVKEKDEDSEKAAENAEKARANEENAESNEGKKYETEKNQDANNKQALSNEKILEEILRGDDGNKTAVATDDMHHHENVENKTIKIDPTIIAAKMSPTEDDEKLPDVDRKDEDVGVMGMDDRPAIEEKVEVKNNTGKLEQADQKQNKSSESHGGKTVDHKNEDPQMNDPKDQKQHQIKESHGNKTDESKKENSKDEPNKGKLENSHNTEYMKNVTHIEHTQNENKTDHGDVGSALASEPSTSNSSILTNMHNVSESKNVEKVEKKTKKILAFGDSLTKGLYKDIQRHVFYNPYSRHLTELLENGDPDKKCKIYEEGVSGECACGGMTKRLPQELDEKKDLDLIIIIAGTNDLLHNDCLKKCDLYEAIKKLHELAKRRKIKSVVTTILLSTIGADKMTPKEYKDVLFDINQKLRGYAQQEENHKQMKLCDIADEYPRKAPISWDKIHPDAEGYNALAEILYDCIKDFQF